MPISMLPPKTLLAWFCTEDFQSCLNLLKQKGLLICSRLNSLEGEEDFLWCLNLLKQRGLVICYDHRTLELAFPT